MINSIIKEILTKELKNIEEVKSETEKSTEIESEKNDNWLENNLWFWLVRFSSVLG